MQDTIKIFLKRGWYVLYKGKYSTVLVNKYRDVSVFVTKKNHNYLRRQMLRK